MKLFSQHFPKSIMEFGLFAATVDELDKLNEFSEQEMAVIEGLMETKTSVPLIRSAFFYRARRNCFWNSGECVMTYGKVSCVWSVRVERLSLCLVSSYFETMECWFIDCLDV